MFSLSNLFCTYCIISISFRVFKVFALKKYHIIIFVFFFKFKGFFSYLGARVKYISLWSLQIGDVKIIRFFLKNQNTQRSIWYSVSWKNENKPSILIRLKKLKLILLSMLTFFQKSIDLSIPHYKTTKPNLLQSYDQNRFCDG